VRSRIREPRHSEQLLHESADSIDGRDNMTKRPLSCHWAAQPWTLDGRYSYSTEKWNAVDKLAALVELILNPIVDNIVEFKGERM